MHLPASIDDEEHADLANAVWAVAFGADSVEVDAPNADAVNAKMDELWKHAPEWTSRGWRRPRRT